MPVTTEPEVRKVSCLCGGWLTARDIPADIHQAVVLHQENGRHTTWSVRTYGRTRYGPPPTLVPPPDPTLPGDVSRRAVGPVPGRLRRVEP